MSSSDAIAIGAGGLLLSPPVSSLRKVPLTSSSSFANNRSSVHLSLVDQITQHFIPFAGLQHHRKTTALERYGGECRERPSITEVILANWFEAIGHSRLAG